MRINRVEDKKVDVTLDADELVKISNVMYFYEQNCKKVEEKKPDGKFHKLNAEIILARDLCQYGGLDGFSLRHIVRHHMEANPKGEMADYFHGREEDS